MYLLAYYFYRVSGRLAEEPGQEQREGDKLTDTIVSLLAARTTPEAAKKPD